MSSDCNIRNQENSSLQTIEANLKWSWFCFNLESCELIEQQNLKPWKLWMIRTGTGFMFDGFPHGCIYGEKWWSDTLRKHPFIFLFQLEFSTTPTVFPSSSLTPNKKNESGEDLKKEMTPSALYKWKCLLHTEPF
jgi:hypothetical protein